MDWFVMSRRQHLKHNNGNAYHASVLALGVYLFCSVFMVGCAADTQEKAAVQGKISAVGSTALQPLVSAAAERFHKQYAGAEIDVKGGGSVYGLSAVNEHQAEIGDSDLYADPAIYPDPSLTDHLICAIPFTLIVGKGIPISSLTRQQIIDIFSTGKIRNWKLLGGPDLPVVPVIRPATSGTRNIFRKYVLGGLEENGTLLSVDTSQAVRDKIANTPGAIGYVARSVVDNSVLEVAIDGVKPSDETIGSGHYTFWGYEHMYTLGSKNTVVNNFIQFMLSSDIQQLAASMSYIPIEKIKVQTLRARLLQSLLSDPLTQSLKPVSSSAINRREIWMQHGEVSHDTF